MYLGNLVSGLFDLQAKLDPESQAAKVFEARIKALQQADKILEMQLNRINSQRDAVSKELDAVQKVVSQNVKNSFGILGR
jgi:hypothetical protein